MAPLELYLLFFCIALLYSSVGFGGGSSYLAILALYSFDEPVIRLTALLCNIVVVSGGCWIYYRAGHLNWRRIAPLVIVSVPLAFLGGRIRLEEVAFFLLLGSTLLIAGLMILWQSYSSTSTSRQQTAQNEGATKPALIGGSIGFLSGLVGIGGGIFLSPILNLLRWDAPKAIAATASVYILLNSISGILGQISRPIPSLDWTLIGSLLLVVFIGGQMGSRLGARLLAQEVVRRATAILVIFVAIRILIKYL
ncbi:MAG: sulfite exporter TauE/SafE family protein [Bacteroidota bacterium]